MIQLSVVRVKLNRVIVGDSALCCVCEVSRDIVGDSPLCCACKVNQALLAPLVCRCRATLEHESVSFHSS